MPRCFGSLVLAIISLSWLVLLQRNKRQQLIHRKQVDTKFRTRFGFGSNFASSTTEYGKKQKEKKTYY